MPEREPNPNVSPTPSKAQTLSLPDLTVAALRGSDRSVLNGASTQIEQTAERLETLASTIKDEVAAANDPVDAAKANLREISALIGEASSSKPLTRAEFQKRVGRLGELAQAFNEANEAAQKVFGAQANLNGSSEVRDNLAERAQELTKQVPATEAHLVARLVAGELHEGLKSQGVELKPIGKKDKALNEDLVKAAKEVVGKAIGGEIGMRETPSPQVEKALGRYAGKAEGFSRKLKSVYSNLVAEVRNSVFATRQANQPAPSPLPDPKSLAEVVERIDNADLERKFYGEEQSLRIQCASEYLRKISGDKPVAELSTDEYRAAKQRFMAHAEGFIKHLTYLGWGKTEDAAAPPERHLNINSPGVRELFDNAIGFVACRAKEFSKQDRARASNVEGPAARRFSDSARSLNRMSKRLSEDKWRSVSEKPQESSIPKLRAEIAKLRAEEAAKKQAAKRPNGAAAKPKVTPEKPKPKNPPKNDERNEASQPSKKGQDEPRVEKPSDATKETQVARRPKPTRTDPARLAEKKAANKDGDPPVQPPVPPSKAKGKTQPDAEGSGGNPNDPNKGNGGDGGGNDNDPPPAGPPGPEGSGPNKGPNKNSSPNGEQKIEAEEVLDRLVSVLEPKPAASLGTHVTLMQDHQTRSYYVEFRARNGSPSLDDPRMVVKLDGVEPGDSGAAGERFREVLAALPPIKDGRGLLGADGEMQVLTKELGEMLGKSLSVLELSGVKFTDQNAIGFDMADAKLTNVVFERCHMIGNSFEGAKLENCTIKDCPNAQFLNLAGAQLLGTTEITNSGLQYANLTDLYVADTAKMLGVNAVGADMRGLQSSVLDSGDREQIRDHFSGLVYDNNALDHLSGWHNQEGEFSRELYQKDLEKLVQDPPPEHLMEWLDQTHFISTNPKEELGQLSLIVLGKNAGGNDWGAVLLSTDQPSPRFRVVEVQVDENGQGTLAPYQGVERPETKYMPEVTEFELLRRLAAKDAQDRHFGSPKTGGQPPRMIDTEATTADDDELLKQAKANSQARVIDPSEEKKGS